MTLNQVVEEYLNSNGIKKEYFASYIGCGLSKCTMWFKGERKLNTEDHMRRMAELCEFPYLV